SLLSAYISNIFLISENPIDQQCSLIAGNAVSNLSALVSSVRDKRFATHNVNCINIILFNSCSGIVLIGTVLSNLTNSISFYYYFSCINFFFFWRNIFFFKFF